MFLLHCCTNTLLTFPFCLKQWDFASISMKNEGGTLWNSQKTLCSTRPQKHSKISYYYCNKCSVSASHSQISPSIMHTKTSVPIYFGHKQLSLSLECSDIHKFGDTQWTPYCLAIRVQNQLQVLHPGELNKLYYFTLPFCRNNAVLMWMAQVGGLSFVVLSIFVLFDQMEVKRNFNK